MIVRSIQFRNGKRGILEQTREEWEAENGPLEPTGEMVNQERERRKSAGFEFMGYMFDSDQAALQNITGGGSLAGFAMGAGAAAGNMMWHGGVDPFVWITKDNQIIEMDAPSAFGLAQAAAAHISQVTMSARRLKDMGEIPLDYTDGKHWS